MCSLLALLVSPLFLEPPTRDTPGGWAKPLRCKKRLLVEAKEERLMAIFADELHIAAHDLRHGELPELM
jgi:hypothetical protein